MYDHLRSDWLPAGEPFNGPGLRPSAITEIVIHYIGTARAPRDSKVWMLNEHRRTMARENPYAFMYNAHVAFNGETWEGRGTQFRNAANGAKTNPTTWSIVFAVDGQNPASEKQIAGCRRLVDGIREFVGRQIPIVPHRNIGSTACPGEEITRQINESVFERSITVTRIAGSNRYATAVLISQRVYPKGSKTVYIASGTNFPDALSAGMLADGPILLTDPNNLPVAVRAEITRLRPENIVIIGGLSAVSQNVENQLNQLKIV